MAQEKSFTEVAFVHYNYFINIAKRFTRNQMDAEDLVQDTYLRAFRFYSSFRQGSNCRAWLFTIMKNSFINDNRKYKDIYEYNFDDVQEKQKPIEENTFTKDELLNLMTQIKDEFRCVIVLFHLEEFSLKEISKQLNWPIGTVKSRLHRGRKEFRKILTSSIVK